MTERVLVTGSRNWTDLEVIREALMKVPPGGIVAHGAARGADRLVDEAVKTLPLFVQRYPVDTKIDGPWPAAGVKRNSRMLADFKPTLCLAFPTEESRGTWDMVGKCRAAGVEVRVFPGEGHGRARMTNETKLPKRRANTWPVLMECVRGEYTGAVRLPSWKVTRCTASKEGGYLLRVFPADAQVIEPFQWPRSSA